MLPCAHTSPHYQNGVFISLAIFAQLTAETAYTLQWAAPFPPRNCLFTWGSGPSSNTWFRGPTRLHITNGISDGLAIFAGLKIKVRTDSSTEFGWNPILIVQIRTALHRAVDFNECITAFTTGRACTPISDIKDGNADIQLRCGPAHNQCSITMHPL